jgi:hypothetical protein
MKLISMTDFVLKTTLDEAIKKSGVGYTLAKINKYANFLKKHLELWMFVPCDENGKFLEEKSIFNTTDEEYIFNSESFDNYEKAKERVLFKDCTSYKPMSNSDYYVVEFNEMKIWLTHTNRTIEDLIQCDLSLSVSFEAIT